MSDKIFIECGDVTVNRERILYIKKSVDDGVYIIFFDNQESITVSGDNAMQLLYAIRHARSASSMVNGTFALDGDLISRRKQDAREGNMIPCSRCGRGALPRGVTYSGPVVCRTCRSKEGRVRMAG